MMVIEMRESAKERVMDLLEEVKELGHRKKMLLCELEDALYECFESEKDDREEDEEMDKNYRRSRAYRRRSMMRDHSDERDEMEPIEERRHYGMRMRRY